MRTRSRSAACASIASRTVTGSLLPVGTMMSVPGRMCSRTALALATGRGTLGKGSDSRGLRPRERRRGIARRTLLPERQELLARHRIDATDGQPAPTDGPVAGRELAGTTEVSLGRLAPPGPMQVPGERELRASLLLLARGQHLMRADLLRREPPRPLAYPGTHRGEKRPRGPPGEGDEQVAPGLDVVRTDDPPALVDPDHGGNVDDVEEIDGCAGRVDPHTGPSPAPPEWAPSRT